MRICLGARKSDLARLQALRVAQALEGQFPGKLEITYKFKTSLGDQDLESPLWKMPGKGVFTEDFVEDLKERRCDAVVHS